MPKQSAQDLAQRLLKEDGRTFAEEIGFQVKDTPQSLFKLLCASMLFGKRIRSDIAVKAAQDLFEKWDTPQKMAKAPWRSRTRVLNRSGYARYDESTSTLLEDTSRKVIERYQGDLRKLHARAGGDIKKERELLKEFKGIGDAGTDIFFREIQGVWEELFPFADKRALKGAEEIGIPKDPEKLARLVPKEQYPAFVASLVRRTLSRKKSEKIS